MQIHQSSHPPPPTKTPQPPPPPPTSKPPSPSPPPPPPPPPPPSPPPPSPPPPPPPPPPPSKQPLPPPPLITPSSPLPPQLPSPTPSDHSPIVQPEPSPTDPFKSTQPFCIVSNDCPSPEKTFCNLNNRCQDKSQVGEKCDINNKCLDDLICQQNLCGYKDFKQTPKNRSYDIKKSIIIGGSILGVSCASGLIFFIYRYIKKRKDRRDFEITSNIYSTDETRESEEPDGSYPFSKRTNSFSDETVPPPLHGPNMNHYDYDYTRNVHPPPPTGNGGFLGQRRGYNNYYNDGRTMNLLQQTRGNVIPPPPPPQQNYNWNYQVPQRQMMNQGGLFPIPSVKRNYNGYTTNNNNNNNNNGSSSSSNNNISDNSLRENGGKSHTPPSGSNLNLKKPQPLRDPNNKLSNNSSMYNMSIYDAYTDSPSKTLEVKLSKSASNLNSSYENDSERIAPYTTGNR